MRMLIPLALAALLTLAPVKAEDDATTACPDGQVESPEGCSDQAWVDDCPPEHMCATGADDPQAYGDEGCIDCTGAPVDEPATCMDGTDDGDVCMEDVQYLGGPGQVPPVSDDDALDTDGDAESDAGDDSSKDAAALTAAVWVALVGVLAFVLRRK